jgi:internalin A
MRALRLIVVLLLISCKTRLDSNTTTLNLSNQKLTAIPDSVFSLVKLERLYLGNAYTIYPPLSALGGDSEGPSGRSMNQITQIPEDIDQLKNLRTFDLGANDLRSLPKGMIKLGRLDTLDISFNKHLIVSRELNTLAKMHWLKYLNIAGTHTDPSSIDNLRKALPNTRIVSRLDEIIEEVSN